MLTGRRIVAVGGVRVRLVGVDGWVGGATESTVIGAICGIGTRRRGAVETRALTRGGEHEVNLVQARGPALHSHNPRNFRLQLGIGDAVARGYAVRAAAGRVGLGIHHRASESALTNEVGGDAAANGVILGAIVGDS